MAWKSVYKADYKINLYKCIEIKKLKENEWD